MLIEVTIATIVINKSKFFVKNVVAEIRNIIAKKIDPIAPEIVLLGLIFVNFFPFNSLPKTKPPMSENTHVRRIINKRIFKCSKKENIKKIRQKNEI